MSLPPHVLLAQIENKFLRKKISASDYKRQKWELIQTIHNKVETVLPLIRGSHPKEKKDKFGSAFRYIIPGPFMYGPEGECAEILSGLYIGKYLVTVKEFMFFLEKKGWEYSSEDKELLNETSPEENCPVSCVSWLDAKGYCRWLSEETGEYYNLPSELEWEMAARGIDGRPYPWGYQEPYSELVCAQCDVAYEHTAPVGSFSANKSPFGCIDMAGNVWEWCRDSFDDSREPHVLRGGSWIHDADYANCISKIYSHPPEKRINYGGFRLAYLPGKMLDEYKEKTPIEE